MIGIASRLLGSRTTAAEARGTVSLEGKIAIVTGASSGIGTETARVLAMAGARVVMACRSVPAGESIAIDLRRSIEGSGSLEVEALDLADLASVRAFAARFVAKNEALHILVNNAGIMATPLGKTVQGSELQVGTNHVGHFLLTKLLRPALERSAPSRIVNVSSALYLSGSAKRLFETLESDPGYVRRRYIPFAAYSDSKLANVLFTRKLSRDLPSSVAVFAVHPGVVATNLSRSMGLAGTALRSFIGQVFQKSIPQGAATTVYAATAPELEDRSGVYLSDCTVGRTSRVGRDDALATRLWNISERLVASFAQPI